MNKQIEQTNQQGWVGDLFGNKKEMQAARTRAENDLDSVNQGIQKTRDNLENVGKARFLVQTGVANTANQLASDINTITSQTESLSDKPLSPWGGEDPGKVDKRVSRR